MQIIPLVPSNSLRQGSKCFHNLNDWMARGASPGSWSDLEAGLDAEQRLQGLPPQQAWLRPCHLQGTRMMNPWLHLPVEFGHCSNPPPRSWVKKAPGHSQLSIPWDTAHPDSTALTVWRHSAQSLSLYTPASLCYSCQGPGLCFEREKKNPVCLPF